MPVVLFCNLCTVAMLIGMIAGIACSIFRARGAIAEALSFEALSFEASSFDALATVRSRSGAVRSATA